MYADGSNKLRELGLAQQILAHREKLAEITTQVDGSDWLARLFERIGDSETAIVCYQEELKSHSPTRTQPIKVTLQPIRRRAEYREKIATLQIKLGKLDDAVLTLKEAIKEYDALDCEVRDKSEQMENYFPTVSDLNEKLANLYLRQQKYHQASECAQQSVELIEKTVGANTHLLREPLTTLAASLVGLKRTLRHSKR